MSDTMGEKTRELTGESRTGPHRGGHGSGSHDHPVAGALFLVLVAAVIGLSSSAAIRHSNEVSKNHAQVAVDRQIKEAIALGQAGNFRGAEEKLRAVLAHHPDDENALFNLGVALLGLERFDDADRVFLRLLELHPADFDAMAERAGLLKRKGQVDEALTLLEGVPVGAGHVADRLKTDPVWSDVAADPRMTKLKTKHGLRPEIRSAIGEP